MHGVPADTQLDRSCATQNSAGSHDCVGETASEKAGPGKGRENKHSERSTLCSEKVRCSPKSKRKRDIRNESLEMMMMMVMMMMIFLCVRHCQDPHGGRRREGPTPRQNPMGPALPPPVRDMARSLGRRPGVSLRLTPNRH